MDLQNKLSGFEKFSILDLFTEYFSELISCRKSIIDARNYNSRGLSENGEGKDIPELTEEAGKIPAAPGEATGGENNPDADTETAAIRSLNLEDLPEFTREVMKRADTDIAPYVSEHLKRVLREQSHWVGEVANAAQQATYNRAMYVMAALTDEIFLWEPLWEESDKLVLSDLVQTGWQGNLLEKKLFGTSSAGDRFFDEVEKLELDSNVTEAEEELASVLLLALRLGFQGQYRGGDEQEISKIKQQLFKLQGGAGNYDNQHLFEETYQNKITPRTAEKFVSHRRWFIGTLAALLIYIFSAIVSYYMGIAELEHELPPLTSNIDHIPGQV